MRTPLLALLLLFVGTRAAAQQEHGTVTAIHTTAENRFIPGYRSSDGSGNNGVNVRHVAQVYRVETANKFLDLQGGRRTVLELGDVVDFRIGNGNAFIIIGKKEKKFRIVGEELKPK